MKTIKKNNNRYFYLINNQRFVTKMFENQPE